MILPSEKDLRAALARFAEVRFAHDVHPTAHSAGALEDAEVLRDRLPRHVRAGRELGDRERALAREPPDEAETHLVAERSEDRRRLATRHA